MLRQFEVSNYKGFENKLIFNLDARDYEYNKILVKKDIVNKAIIYGKNGVGKSSLGTALFDIVQHLTDKERMAPGYRANYRNLNHNSTPACFKYIFQFGEDDVIYEYQKMTVDDLVSEKLMINGKVVIDYNYFDDNIKFVDEEICGNLNIDLIDNKLSVIKYIYRNTPTNETAALTKMVKFCENMLWFRSLSNGNEYFGFTNGGSMLVEKLYESGKLNNFIEFLKSNSLDYKLKFEPYNGTHELFAYFDDGKTPFTSIASTGTMALFLFFIWKIAAFDNVSLLFIDEFDAFLHYEASEELVKVLNRSEDFQTILTTHNTSLMNNKLTRPDCCYVLTNNKLLSLFNATDRELREGHNLEKLYKSGEFDG